MFSILNGVNHLQLLFKDPHMAHILSYQTNLKWIYNTPGEEESIVSIL